MYESSFISRPVCQLVFSTFCFIELSYYSMDVCLYFYLSSVFLSFTCVFFRRTLRIFLFVQFQEKAHNFCFFLSLVIFLIHARCYTPVSSEVNDDFALLQNCELLLIWFLLFIFIVCSHFFNRVAEQENAFIDLRSGWNGKLISILIDFTHWLFPLVVSQFSSLSQLVGYSINMTGLLCEWMKWSRGMFGRWI